MKLAPHEITMNNLNQIQELCPLNTYKACNPDEFLSILPKGIVDKSIKMVVVGSGSGLNMVYMINCLRLDQKDCAIDQQPFIIACSGEDLTAGFIQHGDWPGRTIHPPPSFFTAITSSGIMEHYPYIGIPDNSQGNFDELMPASHREAFWTGIKMIK
ncbi:MAG: hypothetical protein KAS87_05925 [Candidatus Omnitrophica bacterium]|nr:hypothetical protein [Candidatus Omnitrophota bacterium]